MRIWRGIFVHILVHWLIGMIYPLRSRYWTQYDNLLYHYVVCHMYWVYEIMWSLFSGCDGCWHMICSHKYTNLCYVVVVFFFRLERYKGGIILFKRLFYSSITALYDTLWMWLSLEADRLYRVSSASWGIATVARGNCSFSILSTASIICKMMGLFYCIVLATMNYQHIPTYSPIIYIFYPDWRWFLFYIMVLYSLGRRTCLLLTRTSTMGFTREPWFLCYGGGLSYKYPVQ